MKKWIWTSRKQWLWSLFCVCLTEEQFFQLFLSPIQLWCSFFPLLSSVLLTYLFSWPSDCHNIFFRKIGSDTSYIFFTSLSITTKMNSFKLLERLQAPRHFGSWQLDSLYSILMKVMTSIWSTLNVDLVLWHHLHLSMISEYERVPELLKIIAG